jgi:hypothetical protein
MVKNMDNQDITEFTLINKIQKHLKEVQELRFQLADKIEEPSRFYSGNIDKRLLNIVAEKYDFTTIIEVYGELYKIDTKKGSQNQYLICRKILWDLSLSKNQFEIERIEERTSDGEYDYTYYEINEEIVNLD